MTGLLIGLLLFRIFFLLDDDDLLVHPLRHPSAGEGDEEADDVPSGDAAVLAFHAGGEHEGDGESAENVGDLFSPFHGI